jgi:transcriptional regulator with XRE-family HTH domain
MFWIFKGAKMIIGERLRQIREQKNLSQGDIERKTGLLRCYVSRVENGHTVPAIETLEKLARAMDVPVCRLFYDGEKPPELPALPKREKGVPDGWGATGKESRFLRRFRTLLRRMEGRDRTLLLGLAQKMVSKGRVD